MVVAPIAASVTMGSIQSLRMILWAVLLPLLAIPAMEAIVAIHRPALRIATVVALIAVFAVEARPLPRGVRPRSARSAGDVFEAEMKPVVEAALRHGGTI